MDLIERLKALVAEERKITVEILRLLLEVEDKRLFAVWGFSSIYEFFIKELGYSEGAAYRRVSAMRLLRREASCADKIASGELSLSNAAKVETALKQARKQRLEVGKEKVAELFQSALGASSKEAEKRIAHTAKVMGVELPRQGARLPASIEEKRERLKALLSHQHPYATKEELLHLVLDEALAKRMKTQGAIAGEVRSPGKRHVPEKLRAAILQRDQNRCSYMSPATSRRCESSHFLEVDHILPFAHGGKTEEANLRILCRVHNSLAAEQAGLPRPPQEHTA